MLKILIIENEESAAISLIKMMEMTGEDFHLMAPFAKNKIQALELLKKNVPDLLFMDVELDDGNAFDLLKEVKLADQTNLVMTTAHDKYAVSAFKFAAIDFLLKPYDLTDIEETLERIKKSKSSKLTTSSIDVLLSNSADKANIDMSISLNDNESTYVEKISNIAYIKAEGAYSVFSFIKGNSVIISKTIKYYDDLLSSYAFIRSHHSYLVNTSQIKRFDKKNGGELILKNDIRIPVSIRKKESVIEILQRNTIH